MIMHRYFLEFEKFHPGILDVALQLRNQGFVRRNMVYSSEIGWEDHVRWFNTLDPERNFYFLVRLKGEPIGVVNIKDIDWESRRGELGIFIGRESILGTPTPFVCCLVLIDLAVKLFHLQPYTKVKSGAKEVEAINASLGFELTEDHGHFIINELNIEKHYALTLRLRNAALALSAGYIDPGLFWFEFDAGDEQEPGCLLIRTMIGELMGHDRDLFVR